MASEIDQSDFVDSDFHTDPKSPFAADAAVGSPAENLGRPPTRAELDAKVSQTQQRLAELKQAQDRLERERAALEEARRRQVEFQTGRDEMLQHLTRGLGLLEEAEFAARRDAEQMSKTLGGLRDALGKVQGLREENWTKDNWSVELTAALTTIDNARMEWNAARLKWPLLSEAPPPTANGPAAPVPPLSAGLETLGFGRLCKLGLGLTWPLALAALGALGLLLFLVVRR
ncbi:MAG: hypothetical protein KGS61_00805 [Verrucomicrobia bacterium]|nr:hypothetical protein [Verrucomicrobiota bacterium]